MSIRFRATVLVAALLAAGPALVLAQDAILPTSQDTWLNGNNPGAVLGAQPVMVIAKTPKIGLVQFDTSALVSADIASATLNASVDSVGTGGTINVHVVRSGWSEGSVSLNTAPNYDAVPFQSFPISTADAGTVVSADISAAVQEWAAAPGSNFGIALTTTNANMKFDSKESGSPMTVDVVFSSVVKPNVATVEKQGGDYSNPLDAVADLDAWCGTTNQFQPSCTLIIGPGRFEMSTSLLVEERITKIVGAGESLTVLSAASGLDTTMRLYGVHMSSLTVENIGGNGAIAVAIQPDECRLENVRLIANGGSSAYGAIHAGYTTYENVYMNVAAENLAWGISGQEIIARHLEVFVRSGGDAYGIGENSEEGDVEIVNTLIDVNGGQSAIGLSIGNTGPTPVSDVRIRVRGGPAGAYGIVSSDYDQWFYGRNLNVEVTGSGGLATGFYVDFFGGNTATLENSEIYVHDGTVNYGMRLSEYGSDGDEFLSIRSSRISGTEFGIFVEYGELPRPVTIDQSVVSGATNSIAGKAEWVFFVGASKLIGPTNPGGGTIKCALVYDEDYSAYTDTCP